MIDSNNFCNQLNEQNEAIDENIENHSRFSKNRMYKLSFILSLLDSLNEKIHFPWKSAKSIK